MMRAVTAYDIQPKSFVSSEGRKEKGRIQSIQMDLCTQYPSLALHTHIVDDELEHPCCGHMRSGLFRTGNDASEKKGSVRFIHERVRDYPSYCVCSCT